MGVETELKFPVESVDLCRQHIQKTNAVWSGRFFETNMVLDTPRKDLRRQNILLRLRQAGDVRLTLKRTPVSPGPDGFKTWEEIETPVDNFEAMKEILFSLGFEESFCYEKVRETWQLEHTLVCLDILPFGSFVELEGDADDIRSVAVRLNLDCGQATSASYHDLNRRHRELHGLPPDSNFVFPIERKEALLAFLRHSPS